MLLTTTRNRGSTRGALALSFPLGKDASDMEDGLQREPASGAAPERAEHYRERAAWHARRSDGARRRARAISWWRLLTFLLGFLAVGWWATTTPAHRPLAAAGVAAALIAFLGLIVVHRRVRRVAQWHAQLRAVNEQGVHRVMRDWQALPAPAPVDVPSSHPYAADLDVVGHASLLRLCDVVSPVPGRPTLLAWLLAPTAAAPVIRERQVAVAELAERVELREELHALALDAHGARADALERLLQWAEGDVWLVRHPGLLWLARVVPALTIAGIAAQVAGLIAWPAWELSVLAGMFVTLSARKQLVATLNGASVRATGLPHHAPMFERLRAASFSSPLLHRLQGSLSTGGGAVAQLRRLDRAAAWAEVRHSPMLYVVLQLLLLWDFHTAVALERWQRDAGGHLRDWVRALGEAESLAGLATVAYDNPEWTYPELRDDDVALLDAEQLGHPLIPESTRVANDVSVGPAGTVLLVTGSNMSGKSTLLRAIGLNVVLAQAGAPACARRLRLPLVSLWTSIRVQDSLEQGLSLFMAELRRLKQIVDAAREAKADGERPILYLFDEILHGTNTAERQVAARRILGYLVREDAIGAVTTHDLTLAAAGIIAGAARPVHFTESFRRTADGLAMAFDYRLRPGIATSANALKLLEMVGLGEEGEA